MENTIKNLQDRLQKVFDHFGNEIRAIRTGRANAVLVEDIKVDVYGSSMRVKDTASITVPDATSIVITPWDKSTMKAIEDGLRAANLGYGVVNMGELIRVTLPELSAERREELKKAVKVKAEDAKVAMRNERRDAIDEVKKAEKDKQIGEDTAKTMEDQIQKVLDATIVRLEEAVVAKEKEISL